MPVAHVGLSRGPRPFPNGFRTGRTETTPVPPTPTPTVLGRSTFIIDNRRSYTADHRARLIVDSRRHYERDNRTTYIVQG